MFFSGLSPRARGNVRVEFTDHVLFGSIPASAGERGHGGYSRSSLRVYPRERGGTMKYRWRPISNRGLSPRARGNALQHFGRRHRRGSIPASAGERGGQGCRYPQTWVYPRERGGTCELLERNLDFQGLSPRARGNACHRLLKIQLSGSIPASAGERVSHCAITFAYRVYPRERGGTILIAGYVAGRLGLSPRARGNDCKCKWRDHDYGSIPASAGERLALWPMQR